MGGSAYNRAWGTDLQLGFREHLILTSYLAKSYSPGVSGDDYAGNIFAEYRSDLWRFEARYMEIQENFNPEVGFVPRRGFRRPRVGFAFTPSPESGPVRQLNPHGSITRHYGFDGLLESERQHWDLEIRLTNGGSVGITTNRNYEFLRESFDPHPGVTVPAGIYRFNEYNFYVGSDPSALIFGDLNVNLGGFFEGDIKSYGTSLGFRTGPQFITTFSFTNTDVQADLGTLQHQPGPPQDQLFLYPLPLYSDLFSIQQQLTGIQQQHPFWAHQHRGYRSIRGLQ